MHYLHMEKDRPPFIPDQTYSGPGLMTDLFHCQALAPRLRIPPCCGRYDHHYIILSSQAGFTNAPSNMAPFWSIDIQLSIVDHHLGITTWSLGELSQAWFGSLTSTDQKNGVRGEVIGFACSRDPYICSILALIRHITYLWTNSASPNTPPAPSSTTQLPHPNPKVTPAVIINQLRLVVHFFGPDLGFLPLGVLDWLLCAAGAGLEIIRLRF